PIPDRKNTFPPHTMRHEVISGIRPSFPGLSQSQGQVTHVLLTRSPLVYPRRGLTARLACVKHAASVRPEPGSNSPSQAKTTTPTTHPTNSVHNRGRQTLQELNPAPHTQRAQGTRSKEPPPPQTQGAGRSQKTTQTRLSRNNHALLSSQETTANRLQTHTGSSPDAAHTPTRTSPKTPDPPRFVLYFTGFLRDHQIGVSEAFPIKPERKVAANSSRHSELCQKESAPKTIE